MYLHKTKNGHYTPPCCYFSGELEVVEILRFGFCCKASDYLHEKMYDYHVLQADETPVLVSKENRTSGSRHYMWVYRTGKMYQDKPIVLYEYQPSRNADHPRVFLKDFQKFKESVFFRKLFLLTFVISMILFRTLLNRNLWMNPLSKVKASKFMR